jgi:hypothetical protein
MNMLENCDFMQNDDQKHNNVKLILLPILNIACEFLIITVICTLILLEAAKVMQADTHAGRLL